MNDNKKFIPFDKMSKKEQVKFNKSKRKDWGSLSPVTRISDENYGKYRRKSKHKEDYDYKE